MISPAERPGQRPLGDARGALAGTGLEAVLTAEGATAAAGCRASVQAVLCPTRRAGAIVVAPHRSAPTAAGVQEASAAPGARRLYGPPSAPDLNPRERCGSKLQTCVRAAKARRREALDEVVKRALATVTEAEARAWCAHCGSVLH